MIITTTNSIEGSTIKKYLDPITKNIVIGSNVLSDIGANFMDFFGGRVDTYEKKLSAIYLDVIEALKVEAKKRRANGLVGLSIDIDEISGGGKQMFMITATGTPVILSTIDNFELESNKTITGSYLSDKVHAKKILETGYSLNSISIKELDFIIQSKFVEFAPYLVNFLYSKLSDEYNTYEKHKKVLYYFSIINSSISKDILYNKLKDESLAYWEKDRILKAIIELGIIDYSRAIKFLNENDKYLKIAALFILNENPEIINDEIVANLKSLSGENLLSFFQYDAEYRIEKCLLGNKEIWLCVCNNTNKKSDDICIHCNRDKKGINTTTGITPEKVQSSINERLAVLETL